jgi:acyl-coenzyme A thioesterase PaaI-like protein
MRMEMGQEADLKKQPTSRMCFVCGESNPAGIHMQFYTQADGSVTGYFCGDDMHQGYPARMHGGIITAILDETMARAVMAAAGDLACGVTVQMTVRFCKPVPLQTELKTVARITKDWPRMFEGAAEVLLPDGTVATEATGRYVKVDLGQMPDFDPEREEWFVRPDPERLPAELGVDQI